MKSIRISDTINKWLLVIGILLMLSTLVLADNPENHPTEPIASGEASTEALKTSLAPSGVPADPTGSINESGGPCGDKTLTRTDSPPLGEVWYWQTSYNGTSVTYDASTYSVSASGTYYIKAYKPSSQEWSNGYISKTVTVTQTPSAPAVSEESSNGTSSFVAHWSAVSGATDYRLDVATNSSFTALVTGYDDKTVTGTSHTVSGLNGGQTFYYRLRAHNGCTSANSSAITAHTTLDDPVASEESNAGTDSFQANWSAVSGTNSYRLDVSTNTGFTTYVTGYNDRAVVGTSESVTGLNPAATYYYRVRAYSTAYTSGNSATITATTTLAIPTVYEETGQTTTSFQANWNSVSGAAAYRLDVSTNSSFTALLSGYDNKVVSGTNHTVTGLTPGTNYYYRVRAYSSVYTSGNSATITANTTLSTPVAQQPACATTSSFTATWGSISGATEYLLYVSDNSGFSSHVSGYNGVSVTGTSHNVTGLSAGTYYYRLKSKNSVYTSGYSNAITVTVPGVYNVTGGIQCSTAGTLTVGLDGSQSGMEYQLYYNAAPVLVEGTSTIVKAFGNGSAITFTYDADQVGTYTVYAVNGSCNTLMTGNAQIVTTPTLVTVSGGGSFCSGTAGVPVTLSSAQSGVTYELFRNGTTTGQTTTTTSFGNQVISGNYTVKASKGGCTVDLAETVVVTVVAGPSLPTDSVSTNTCGERIIYAINAPHASTNVFWKWQGTNSDGYAEDAFTSTGITVDSTATYYVRAKDEGTGCWSPSVAVAVTVILNPVSFPAHGGGDYCVGQTSPALHTMGSEPDVTYKLHKDGSYLSGQDKNGDAQGGPLTWTGLSGGSYQVVGERSGCPTTMYGTVVINESANPVVNAGPDLTLFQSDMIMLPGSDSSGVVWTSGTATITSNFYNARLDGTGTYAMTYTYTNSVGCSGTDDINLTVVDDPGTIALTAGSRFINTDPQASVLAPTLTAPTGYSYQWYKDGVAMTGKTTNTLQPDETGAYDVEIMTTSGFGIRSNAIAVVPLRATDNVNHVTTRQLRAAVTDENSLPTDKDSVAHKIDFMDDLGRPVQTVIENQSTSGLDMVQPIAYDAYGRNPKAYLPFTSSVSVLFKNDALAEQGSFYATTSGIAQDDAPYSENTFEASPLNRVLKTNAPGVAWAKTDSTAGKPVTFDFSANAANEVLKWEINGDALRRNGSYTAGTLSKNVTTDENGKQVEEFKNLQGQVILKKVQASDTAPATDSDWYQTYYVYDEFNNLRYVLPPMAVQQYESHGQSTDTGDQLVTVSSGYEEVTTSSTAKVGYLSPAIIYINKGTTIEKGAEIYRVTAANATITLNEDFLAKWAFRYRYDNRQRMTMKQVPGADSVLMIYDERDRLVMTQDGNQRTKNEWLFTKYDQINRPVLTGIVSDGRSRASIQTEVNGISDFDENYTGTGTLMGYDGSGYPATAGAGDLLTVTYYDNYGFTGDSHWGLGNFTTKPEARTLVTGSKLKVPGQTNWNEMITLYDDFYRLEHTVSKDYQNNRDSLVNEYYSEVLPLVTKTTHIHLSALTNDTTTLVKDYAYDHADRLLSVTHQVNSETAVVILENEYNELGELIAKKLNKEGTNQYSQEIDYTYNIRGWLTKINDPVAPDASDYFNMQLKYDEAGQYNGNIGATSWKNPFETATNSYAYSYDAVNRIKSAGYSTTATGGMDFDLNNVTYDANGNILTLRRTGNHADQVAQLFDDLDYDYVGNQLTKVTDASGKDTGFKDGANTTNEYVYDANGNMISDANKGIDSIAYNHLNLPIRVEMNADGSNRIEYIYDAAGIKMAQLVYGADTLTKRTDYQGAFIYEDSVLQFIQHEEGRVVRHPGPVPGSQTFDYQYHLKDHLGNVRATFKTSIDADTYEATLETENDATESQYFQNLTTRATHGSANKTTNGNEAAALSNSAMVGPAISLKVLPGDTIDMEVWAYYEGGSGYNSQVTLASFISSLAATFGGASGAGGESGAIFDGIDDAVTAGAGGIGGSGNDAVPAAYLSYILFDDNYNEIQNGYQEITSSASFAHEKLFLNDIDINQSGYLYIYTSMQSDVTSPVYFDDLKVTHTHSPIVSKDDYYPFGLTFNSYSRPAMTAQNFKYNSFEFMNELDLALYDYQARYYDPALGRFIQVDPAADVSRRFSTYAYALDNPIRYIDPDGMVAQESGATDQTHINGNKDVDNTNEDGRKVEEIETNPTPTGKWGDTPLTISFMGTTGNFWDTYAGQDIAKFLNGDFFTWNREEPTKKATTDIDGISVENDGSQPDNAPNTTGDVDIVDEDVIVDNVPPNELSQTQQLPGSILDWIFKTGDYEATSDSSIVANPMTGEGHVVPGNTSGGHGSPRYGARKATKADSIKYGLIK